MNIDYNYHMKVSFKMRILSLFVMLFFVFNISSLILMNIKDCKFIGLNITEQFFSVKNFSDNIISKMLSNKMHTNKQQKKENKKEQNNKVDEFLLTNITLPLSSNSFLSFGVYSFVSVCIQQCLIADIEYPLKIPFLLCIFLMLILKMLFNVLPRSISIDYNKMYIEGACIV